ncbi:MAG: DUF4954 family protein [Spirochaetaceae bacterium]
MDTVTLIPGGAMGREFIPKEYLPEGEDEYYLRNAQLSRPLSDFRHLRAHEIELLVKNGNVADNWDDVLVTDEFDAAQVLNNSFHGLVRIGAVSNAVLEHHDLQLPVGITSSNISSCDIGDYVGIHNVRYLAHYIIGDRCIITNVDEMHCTDHAKFGNGILKDGESEDVLITLDLINESGSRAVQPFDGMIPADAYLWARYRDDEALQRRLAEMTQERSDSRRGYYGTVGEQCVLKNSRIFKDVKIGSHCYVKGANKLKNLTINSNAEEPSQIGEGVELVNGIIGFGCRVFYGCKAVRFIMGNNSELKYGARLIHSFMGDNSTVSCCELLNNLMFPAHEQHHNNSFLIASVVKGQSNIAAGATIGSNHNSRANDNEIEAGRGFWPGLCTSLKHSSRFASFVLLAKGHYPAELDIPFPFALLSNNVAENRLEVMPAFWWMHNMYALARNSWKFAARDRRKQKTQNIEFDALAPDTVEEIISARRLLAEWTARAKDGNSVEAASEPATAEPAGPRSAGRGSDEPRDRLIARGHALLTGDAEETAGLPVRGERMEKTHRETLILKPREGYEAYAQMLHYYAAVNLIAYLEAEQERTYESMCRDLDGERETEWSNLGGQLVAEKDLDVLRRDIGNGVLSSWDEVHARYNELWRQYPLSKQRHAFAVYRLLHGGEVPDRAGWRRFMDEAVRLQELKRDRVYETRRKDYENPFRFATYRNETEMKAALGDIEDNRFVGQVREETESFKRRAEAAAGA